MFHQLRLRTKWMACVFLVFFTVIFAKSLASQFITNWALIHLLNTPLCDPSWYVCDEQPNYYPPQVWEGNQSALRESLDALQLALRLDSDTNSIQEHLVELEYALGNEIRASKQFESLLVTGQLRGNVLRKNNPPFHFLVSYIKEQQGDFYDATKEIRTGLQLANFELDTTREIQEVRRLSSLIRKLNKNQVSDEQTQLQQSYAAILYSACAGEWSSVWEEANRLIPSTKSLTIQQESILFRLLALQAGSVGNTSDETKWLKKAGEVEWDQWNIGNPYLWLGNQLLNTNTSACFHGTKTIYDWYSESHPNSAQGFYLLGISLLTRKDYASAKEAFASGYQRDFAHVDSARGLAIANEMLGDLQTSVEWYQRAIELWPTNGEYHARLARVLHSLGDNHEAAKEFDQAIGLSPQEDLFLVWTGFFYMDLEQNIRSRSYFEAALALNPDNQYAKNALIQIGGP